MPGIRISCSSCDQSDKCPQKTKLFVNYCGCKGDRIDKAIHDALSDCKSRRGFVMKVKQ